jgi:hypothetical protein
MPILTRSREGQLARVRELIPSDVFAVRHLLSVLPHIRPHGDEWLVKRLGDALVSRAQCRIVVEATPSSAPRS